jgi:molybdopterin-guanine dinucleotide biosynthesis protein MobB
MLFHPFEIAVCGYSGSGKTTLIEAVVSRLSAKFTIGYYKHGCHQFDIDREGKDSWTIKEAGALTVMISDPEKKALITQERGLFSHLEQHAFSEMDMLLVEGLKEIALPKLLLVDKERKILDLLSNGSVTNVAALVVPDEPSSYQGFGIPVLHRDQTAVIAAFIESFLVTLSSKECLLNGLVLAGGKSHRMGHDKALIAYHPENQLQYTANLLREQCHEVFVSCREEQAERYLQFGIPLITDSYLGIGPMGGLLSAQQFSPGAAWVVAACDMPFLDHTTVSQLCLERNQFRFATAFRSPESDALEPLFACYEPKTRSLLFQRHCEGKNSLSAFLKETRIHEVTPLKSNALQNINDGVEKELSRIKKEIT